MLLNWPGASSKGFDLCTEYSSQPYYYLDLLIALAARSRYDQQITPACRGTAVHYRSGIAIAFRRIEERRMSDNLENI